MLDDIRYLEFQFLRALAEKRIETFNRMDEKQKSVFDGRGTYTQMVATLIEELYVQFRREEIQRIVSKLRGELSPTFYRPHAIDAHLWDDPRSGLERLLSFGNVQDLQITYRGFRRIEELREILRRDRVLDDFGVLTSIRYLRADLTDALQRPPDIKVSLLCADMDDFGRINKRCGHSAGDVVMRSYLETVRDCVGMLGTAYRGVGDEVVAIFVGQEHARVVQIAERIKRDVANMRCDYRDEKIPKVTTSLSVTTSPPEPRTMEIENLAEARKLKAKELGKNRVVSG